MSICVIKRKLSKFGARNRLPRRFMGRWDAKAVAFECHQGVRAVNALAKLLELTSEEKIERGLLYTPAEIAQQPATWEATFSIFQEDQARLAREFTGRRIGRSCLSKAAVFSSAPGLPTT